MGGIETCDVLDTRGLLLVPGRPTKSSTTIVIRYKSSVERPAGGWATGWPKMKQVNEVDELSSVLASVLSGRSARTHNTSENFS